MSNPHSPFRLNVGFIIHQNIGFSREFLFDIPQVHLPPDLDLKDLNGAVRITRTPQGLPIQVKMHAIVNTQCVRCLAEFQQPLDIDFTEMYAFSQKSVTDAELLVPEDGHIDLGELVREYMLIEVPINPLCTPNCKGLCPVCGENPNISHCDHSADEVDSRLAVLKSLLEKEE